MSYFSLKSRHTANSQSGFTLIEIGIALLVAAVLAAGAISYAIPTIKSAKILESQNKIRRVQTALHAYVMGNYRLPCPANPSRTPGAAPNNPPFGYERGSSANGSVTPGTCNDAVGGAPLLSSGIVPFRTLGLSEEDVVDGFGNFLTYNVSPAFAQDPNAALDVFVGCRTLDWMYEDGRIDGTAPQVRNRNPQKARFCCPDYTGNSDSRLDWVVVNENNTYALTSSASGADSPPAAATSRSNVPGNYAPVNIMYPLNPTDIGTPAGSLPMNEKATGIAYVLISHGELGGVAWNVNTGARTAAREAGSWDSANDSADRVIYDLNTPMRGPGARRLINDDIVAWETQENILAAIGQSCALP
jgi:prepilin-type N-terminal cleavage/methylation domain-containing protein